MLVRSRDRRHLENLKAKFKLGHAIRDNEGTDYAYRMSLPKEEWARILSELATEQEYTNFKNEAADNMEQTSSSYVRALHKVWSVMLNTQVGSAPNGSGSRNR
jgi:hypothetical protein